MCKILSWIADHETIFHKFADGLCGTIFLLSDSRIRNDWHSFFLFVSYHFHFFLWMVRQLNRSMRRSSSNRLKDGHISLVWVWSFDSLVCGKFHQDSLFFNCGDSFTSKLVKKIIFNIEWKLVYLWISWNFIINHTEIISRDL